MISSQITTSKSASEGQLWPFAGAQARTTHQSRSVDLVQGDKRVRGADDDPLRAACCRPGEETDYGTWKTMPVLQVAAKPSVLKAPMYQM